MTMYAIFIFIVGTTLALQRVSYYDVYWNSTNPLFEPFDNAIDSPGYYELTANPMDVIKFHCPKKRTEEFSLIYKVSLEEFQRCSLSKDAELIASCNNDRHSVVVRHILRQVHSESGHNYYISTSTGHLDGLENRRLGLCNEKNMRLAVHLSKRELIPQHDTALEGINVDLQRLMQEKFYLAEENGELNWKKNVLPEVEFDWKEYMERHGKKMESVHIEPIPLNDEFVSRWEEMKRRHHTDVDYPADGRYQITPSVFSGSSDMPILYYSFFTLFAYLIMQA